MHSQIFQPSAASMLYTEPIPCNENRVFHVKFSPREIPVMKTGVPAMRTGVPCNENTSQGKPFSGPVLALYRISVYTRHFRKLFAIFNTLKTTFRIAKNLLHPFLKVDIYVHWKVTKHSAFTFLQICQVQRSIYLHLTMDSNSFWYLIWIFLLSYTVSKKNCLNPKGGGGGSKMTHWSGERLSFLTWSCYGHKNSWLYP